VRVTASRPDPPPAAGTAPAADESPAAESPPWLLLWLTCVVAIVVFPAWQVIPYGVAWTSLPLLATVFVALAWQSNRKMAARDRARIAAEAEKLLAVQRQFLQDASHELRTPITIALGHAELLAGALAGRQQRDIHVVVGELERLKALSERLLLVAAAENPDFLTPEPTDLDMLAAELFLRWQPVAARRWRLGQIQPVTALVDAERLELALDALVENAVRYTGPQDEIAVSVIADGGGQTARITVADSGEGIAATDIPHIFDRFRTSAGPGTGGTGLGLALVRAVARGHGGDVTVSSAPGEGSRFELAFPVRPARLGAPRDQAARDQASVTRRSPPAGPTDTAPPPGSLPRESLPQQTGAT